MNQRDWELLHKELRGVSPRPPRNSGILGFAIVFLVGIVVGAFLFSHENKQMSQVASYNAALSHLKASPPTMR